MIQWFVIVYSTCIPIGKTAYHNLHPEAPVAFMCGAALHSHSVCYESMRFSTSSVVNPGEEAKPICDYIGCEWSWDCAKCIPKFEEDTDWYQECKWCLKRRRKITTESWENLP